MLSLCFPGRSKPDCFQAGNLLSDTAQDLPAIRIHGYIESYMTNSIGEQSSHDRAGCSTFDRLLDVSLYRTIYKATP
jgi:hypothetical protein